MTRIPVDEDPQNPEAQWLAAEIGREERFGRDPERAEYLRRELKRRFPKSEIVYDASGRAFVQFPMKAARNE